MHSTSIPGQSVMWQTLNSCSMPQRPTGTDLLAIRRYAKGWFRKAEALQALGRLLEAVTAAERAVELDDGRSSGGASQLLARLRARSAAGSGGEGGRLDAAVRRP